MITLQEVGGKLMKVEETRIDNWNVKRKAVPLSEKEFERIKRNTIMEEGERKAMIARAEAKFKNEVPEEELSGEEQINQVLARAEEAKKRFSERPKRGRPKKAFAVDSSEEESGVEESTVEEVDA